MVSLRYRKDRKRWEIDWREDGCRKRQHFQFKENAQDFLSVKEKELERKRTGLSYVEMISFAKWSEIFKRNHFRFLSNTYAEHTIRIINGVLVPVFGEKYMHEIDKGLIKSFVNKRLVEGSSNKTVINDMSILRTMFLKAIEHGYAMENPCDGIEMPKNIVRKARRPVPLDQLTVFLRKTDDMMRRAILIMVNTGLRVSEMLALKYSDIDLINGFLTVRSEEGRTTKNYKTRVVPIPTVLRDLLVHNEQKDLPVVQLTKSTVESRFFRLRKKLGFTWNMHELRHTYISRSLKAGLDKRTLREYVGHMSDQIIDRYSHFIPENLQAKVNFGQEFVKNESDVVTIWSPENKKSFENNNINMREGGLEPRQPSNINNLENQQQITENKESLHKQSKSKGNRWC